MSFFIIPITALLASILTFFSGFGLGTILLPVFAIYYDLPIAVVLTAIVHFCNNMFKIGLVFKNINWNVFLRFGAPSLLAAIVGAKILAVASFNKGSLYTYHIDGHPFFITGFGILMGSLIICFSLLEIIPFLKQISFNKNKLILGGLLSGFFGGLSGHQGSMRSAFLIRLNLSKETFVATGTAIACIVDIARLSVYAITFKFSHVENNKAIIGIAVAAAIIGALIGNKLLKKTTIGFIKWFVTIFMITIGLLMILGIIA